MKNWGIYALIGVGVVAYNMATNADRDSTGAIIEAGDVDVFSIKVGDCFDDAGEADEISTLPGVPCAEPHDNEAYAAFNVSLDSYPGEDAMWELAYEKCMDRFEGFVGLDYESSVLDIFALYPSTDSWAQNDREVVCAVFNMNYDKLTGSVEGTGI